MLHTEVLGIDGCGKPLIAAITNDEVAVVARFEGGAWHPAYGIRQSGENMELPPSFELHPDVQRTLDDLRA